MLFLIIDQHVTPCRLQNRYKASKLGLFDLFYRRIYSYSMSAAQSEQSDDPVMSIPGRGAKATFEDNGYLPPGIHPAALDDIENRFGRESELRRVQMESIAMIEVVSWS
jgi:hypothetical protein